MTQKIINIFEDGIFSKPPGKNYAEDKTDVYPNDDMEFRYFRPKRLRI